jgi:hypothetical protein
MSSAQLLQNPDNRKRRLPSQPNALLISRAGCRRWFEQQNLCFRFSDWAMLYPARDDEELPL